MTRILARRRFLSAMALLGLAPAMLTRRPAALAASAAPGEADVAIDDFAFAPSPLGVKAGTTVVWTNRDGEPHTVVDVDGGFKSAALDTGDSFRHRFDRPGTFTYVCSLHPHMIGKIVVTA